MDGSHHSYVPAILSTQKFLFSFFSLFSLDFSWIILLIRFGTNCHFLTLLLYQLFTVHRPINFNLESPRFEQLVSYDERLQVFSFKYIQLIVIHCNWNIPLGKVWYVCWFQETRSVAKFYEKNPKKKCVWYETKNVSATRRKKISNRVNKPIAKNGAQYYDIMPGHLSLRPSNQRM